MSEEHVTVFHGTRLSRLENIEKSGFLGVDLTAEVEVTANQHNFSSQQVMHLLDQTQRFVVRDPRSNSVSFSVDFDLAAGHASRGPEVVWETLVSIYRLQHPELGDQWNQSDALHWWVANNSGLDDRPVVIALDMPLNELIEAQVEGGHSLESLEWSFEMNANPRTLVPTEVKLRTPLHQPIASKKSVPLKLDMSLGRYLAGFGLDEGQAFAAEVEAGKWGNVLSDSRSSLEGVYFDWYEFREHLPTDRLAYLLNAD